MSARPILFSAPMIRALLDGRKTQTRRVVHPDIVADIVGHGANVLHRSPYGQSSDLLWCRETWGLVPMWCLTHREPAKDHVAYRAGRRVLASENAPNDFDFNKWPVTWADDLKPEKWRPSIHMPRWASRLTLRLTDARVQRLQEISPDDCIAEGAWPIEHRELGRGHEAIAAFQHLWDAINAARGFGWDVNPWVWALSFEVIRANVDQVLREAA